MGRKAIWLFGTALVLAIYSAPATAQVSVGIGVGTPHIGASVVIGAPVYGVYPYGPLVPYSYPYPYPYYAPYYYYPYAVPYRPAYYRAYPGYYRGAAPYYYRGAPYYRGARDFYGPGPRYYGRPGYSNSGVPRAGRPYAAGAPVRGTNRGNGRAR
jgi:hypothetical protein